MEIEPSAMWNLWPDFVQEQIDSIGLMQENIDRWQAARQNALESGDSGAATRYERLVDMESHDLKDKTKALNLMLKGRKDCGNRISEP